MNPETVLITGASSGIGKASATLFVKNGFRVFGTRRRPQPDEGGVEMLELDIRSDDSVRHCVEEVLARAGQIDILVNNAGVMHLGVAEETAMEDARTVFEINFFGVVRMVNAVLPGMRQRKQGRIINVGSLPAWVGEPGEAFYSASKHALAGYSEALRHEVWPLGIHISLVEPGAFRTSILQAATENRIRIRDYDAVRHAVSRTMQESLRRGGDPALVARVIFKVAHARSPLLRYGVGSEAQWLPYVSALLPQRVFDYVLRRGFGLTKTTSAGG